MSIIVLTSGPLLTDRAVRCSGVIMENEHIEEDLMRKESRGY